MLSVDKVHVVSGGASVLLECKFLADQYNLFDYPVLWRKTQLDEDTQVNIMGNINEPFLSSNRFEAIFSSSAPRYGLHLSIEDVVVEDSGNYTCELRGPQSLVLHHITHSLYVRAAVTMVILSKGYSTGGVGTGTGGDREHNSTTVDTLRLEENRPSVVRCDALGGYPPPSLDVYVGARDVTRFFSFKTTCVKVTGSPGQRRFIYSTERWSGGYLPSADDDQQLLTCVATVPGLKPVVESIHLDVDYLPKVECPSVTEASVGDRDVSIDCEISAKPSITEVLWILDSNGTVLKEGEQTNNYMAVYAHRRDKVGRVQLYIRQVAFDSFRRFTVVAENRVGITTREVELVHYRHTTQPTTPTKPNPVYRDVTRDLVRRNYFYMRSGASAALGSVSVPFSVILCFPIFTLNLEDVIFRD